MKGASVELVIRNTTSGNAEEAILLSRLQIISMIDTAERERLNEMPGEGKVLRQSWCELIQIQNDKASQKTS